MLQILYQNYSNSTCKYNSTFAAACVVALLKKYKCNSTLHLQVLLHFQKQQMQQQVQMQNCICTCICCFCLFFVKNHLQVQMQQQLQMQQQKQMELFSFFTINGCPLIALVVVAVVTFGAFALAQPKITKNSKCNNTFAVAFALAKTANATAHLLLHLSFLQVQRHMQQHMCCCICTFFKEQQHIQQQMCCCICMCCCCSFDTEFATNTCGSNFLAC